MVKVRVILKVVGGEGTRLGLSQGQCIKEIRMMGDRRSPEEFLKAIHVREAQSQRGRLKIFFGFAAGVGKTYAMLEAAQQAKRDGRDVVVGYVEPHARPDTLALLDGLEILPTKQFTYKQVQLSEFDLDAALARRPELLLIDELAHTNAAGSRHQKRYQDVQEVLKAGIDVYTTINVQHLASLNDLVASITGVTVKECIPDAVFDDADEVELIDIEPQDLITRLQGGKIYRENQAQRALNHFFTKENLGALREIALRRTAEGLSHKAQAAHKGGAATKASEHILLCLSASPSNPRVIRTAARMAKAFHSGFTALVVENQAIKQADGPNRKRLQDNIRLAEQLGAQITTVFGDDLPTLIAEYAKESGVTKIVMGRTNHRISFFSGRPLIDTLAPLVGDIDIYIIPDQQPLYKRRGQGAVSLSESLDIVGFGKMILILALCTILGVFTDNSGFSEANVITIYVVGVLFIALWTYGYIYGILGSLASVLAFNYFFTEPRYTLNVYQPGYIITFALMLFAAILVSSLTIRARKQAHAAAQKAYFMEFLLDSSKVLQEGHTPADILSRGADQLSRLLQRPIYVAMESADGNLPFSCCGESAAQARPLTVEEEGIGRWVLKNNVYAGATTATFSQSEFLFYAVRGLKRVVGVVAIPIAGHPDISLSERNLLVAILNECGITMERESLRQQAEDLSVEAEQERFRSNVLRSVSHDLRTPLTSISGNARMLLDTGDSLTAADRQTVYTDMFDDAQWLIRLTENLLAVTKMEGGGVQLAMEAEMVSDIVDEAVAHVDRRIADHKLSVDIGDSLLMAKMDGNLIRQVLINLINNAITYTPKGSNIIVRATGEGQYVRLSVEDDGPGIRDEAKQNLFTMFYKGESGERRGDSRRGMGLGLYLCQSIVRAHGSQILVADKIPHGTIFSFTLEREVVHLDA